MLYIFIKLRFVITGKVFYPQHKDKKSIHLQWRVNIKVPECRGTSRGDIQEVGIIITHIQWYIGQSIFWHFKLRALNWKNKFYSMKKWYHLTNLPNFTFTHSLFLRALKINLPSDSDYISRWECCELFIKMFSVGHFHLLPTIN